MTATLIRDTAKDSWFVADEGSDTPARTPWKASAAAAQVATWLRTMRDGAVELRFQLD